MSTNSQSPQPSAFTTGRSVHRPCFSNSRRNLEQNHSLLCAAHEASASLMHLSAEHTLLLHHNRKTLYQVPKADYYCPWLSTTGHAFHPPQVITMSNQTLCPASHSLPPTTCIRLTSTNASAPIPKCSATPNTRPFCSVVCPAQYSTLLHVLMLGQQRLLFEHVKVVPCPGPCYCSLV